LNDLLLNYIAVDVICTFALVLLALESMRNVLFSVNMKKQFALAALIGILVMAAELGSIIFENIWTAHRGPALAANVIGFSLSPFIAIILAKAFSVGRGRIGSLLTIPAWINAILAASSPWTGLIFSINSDVYERGPLFGVYVAAYLSAYIVLIISSFKAMEYYQCVTKSTFILLVFFSIAGTTVQLIWPNLHASMLCITLSLLLFYAHFCMLTQTQDGLTGLLNRNVYDRWNKHRHHGSGIVIMFDLDGFKMTNDLYGHHWGDACLQNTGRLIRDCFQKLGVCYRVGGDEFCVVCHNADERYIMGALQLFHEGIDTLRQQNSQHGVMPTVSTGHARFDGTANAYQAAVREADERLYETKRERKTSP